MKWCRWIHDDSVNIYTTYESEEYGNIILFYVNTRKRKNSLYGPTSVSLNAVKKNWLEMQWHKTFVCDLMKNVLMIKQRFLSEWWIHKNSHYYNTLRIKYIKRINDAVYDNVRHWVLKWSEEYLKDILLPIMMIWGWLNSFWMQFITITPFVYVNPNNNSVRLWWKCTANNEKILADWFRSIEQHIKSENTGGCIFWVGYNSTKSAITAAKKNRHAIKWRLDHNLSVQAIK